MPQLCWRWSRFWARWRLRATWNAGHMMNDLIAAVFLLIGATFLLLAGVGMVRMPDLFSRMQAATKASTLGVTCILLAVAVHFNDLGITMRALAAGVFFLLTAPVTAHVVGRVSYFLG